MSLVLSFAYVWLTEAFAVARWAVVPGVASSVLLYGWIIAKLCSPSIRAEFDKSLGN